jgi:hypothetical protein
MMVYVDENDVFDDISDKLLIAELKRRKIGLSENTVDMDLARFAYEELRGGRVASAMAAMERLIHLTKFALGDKSVLFPEWRAPS